MIIVGVVDKATTHCRAAAQGGQSLDECPHLYGMAAISMSVLILIDSIFSYLQLCTPVVLCRAF